MKKDDMKKTRARYKCPAEVSEVLRLAKVVSQPFIIRPDEIAEENQKFAEHIVLRTAHMSLEEMFGGGGAKAASEEWFNALQVKVKEGISRLAKAMTVELKITRAGLVVAQFEAYKKFCIEYDQIRQIAFLAKIQQEVVVSVGDTWYISESSGQMGTFPSFTFTVNLDASQTYLQLEQNAFATALNGLPYKRFRFCKVCDYIFWAKREDSRTCSKKCMSTHNVRKFRAMTEEEKAARNLKRKKNREYLKNQKRRS